MPLLSKKTIRVAFFMLIVIIVGFMTMVFCNADNSANNKFLSQSAYTDNSPIDYDTGIINNKYWGIYLNNQTKDCENADAITNALRWAAKNNVREVKLETGVYYIDGQWSQIGGIDVPSNMHFNLNGSTLIQRTNSSKCYSIISFSNKENIIISDGILLGDRLTHDYWTVVSTHEFGFGIIFWACRNVTIDNMNIADMTGDAICINGNGQDTPISQGGIISQNISIKACDISNCRRQGISITGAENVEISECDINNIKGAVPQSGIALEGERDWPVKNVNIHNNTFSKIETVAVLFHTNSSMCIVDNNTIEGSLSVYDGQDNIIRNNLIQNGAVYLTNLSGISNTTIKNNHLINSYIQCTVGNNTTIANNVIVNGSILFVNCSGEISNNKLTNNGAALYYAIRISADNRYGSSSQYFVHYFNNNVAGNYTRADYITKSRCLFLLVQ